MSIRRLRTRLLREDAERGVSLVELLVAVLIAMVMFVLIGRMFAQVTRAAGDNRTTRSATGVAATVMDEVTRVVRQGTQVATSATVTEGAVLTGSTPTALTLDTYANAVVTRSQSAIAPVRVGFAVNATGYLVENQYIGTLTNGYYGFGSTPTSTRSINGPIVTTGPDSSALFVYLDSSGVPVVPASSAGLTRDQAATVVAVTVTVIVSNDTSRGSDPVKLMNTVTMPNLAIVNGGY